MMDDEIQSSVFQSMINTVLFDVDKSNAEGRQETIKLVDKLIEHIEADTVEVNNVYQEIIDEEMARKSACEHLQREIDFKRQETEKFKNQSLILNEEKQALHNNLKRLQELKIDKDIKELAGQVHTLKEEINSKKSGYIKSNLEMMKGIHFYKQYLQCNVFESDGLVVFSLDPSATHISQTQEYVRLKTEDECRTFEIIDYKPEVPNMEKLRAECNETGDLQCFIRNFRKEVYNLRRGKHEYHNKENRDNQTHLNKHIFSIINKR